MPTALRNLKGRIGLALGSGAARGWAHVGVIRALVAAGITPEIVCGTSSGAVVGALYAANRLDAFEAWGRQLDWRQVMGYFDLTFRGGLIKARKLFDRIAEEIPQDTVDALELPFAAVATDLETGREVWLRDTPLVESLRASMALPGLVAPVKIDGRWLVDGGVVNPVPVSLCRAMGADSVIAVDLNTTLLGRRFQPKEPTPQPEHPAEQPEPEFSSPGSLRATLEGFVSDLRRRMNTADADGSVEQTSPTATADRDLIPSLYEVIANSLNIMQVRITRSRMAGDPPDLLVTPRLADFGLLAFDRAEEAIEEGHRAVARALHLAAS